MAECPAPTSSVCTGLQTGEVCAPLKDQVIDIPAIDGLVISSDGTSITVSWSTDISYPDQIVRTHVREAASVGYPAEGFKHTARNSALVTHGGLRQEIEHLVWIRVENATETTGWIVGKITTTPGTNIPLDFVMHFGEVVTHIGELVTF